MSHSYHSCLMHCVWSTKERRNLLTPDARARLWPYIGGISRENGMSALCVGGTENHVHALLSLPSMMSTGKALQLIKGGASKWFGEAFDDAFQWQEGYGAFSIATSLLPQTVAYIQNQEQHHRTKSFEDEFIDILTRCGIKYDPRYVFG